MPFVPVANAALVEVRMLYDFQKVENTLYFTKGTEWDATSLTDLRDSMLSWWDASYSPPVAHNLLLSEVACTALHSETAPSISGPPVSPLSGGVDAASEPGNVSLAISFRTALRGRSFRGRNYICGIPQTAVTLNTVSGGFMTSMVAAYNALHDVADDFSGHWVVVSRFSGVNPTTKKPIPRVAGIATPITAVTIVDPTVDSQRRRLPGRGR